MSSTSSQSSNSQRPQKGARCSRSDRFKEFQAQSWNILAKTDLEIYLDEETLFISPEKDDFNILKWCDVHQCRFLILSLVAGDILAMTISTVSLKSTFNTRGQMLDPFSSSLTSEIVEVLYTLKNWLRKSKQPISFEEDL